MTIFYFYNLVLSLCTWIGIIGIVNNNGCIIETYEFLHNYVALNCLIATAFSIRLRIMNLSDLKAFLPDANSDLTFYVSYIWYFYG